MKDVVSLDETISEHQRQKYDSLKSKEKDIRCWMAKVISERSDSLLDFSKSFHSVLKDGVLLCELGNRIISEKGPKNLLGKKGIDKINQPGSSFKERDNISKYLNVCKLFGFQNSLFETTDLYDGNGMTNVLNNLICLRDVYYKGINPISRRESLNSVHSGSHLGLFADSFKQDRSFSVGEYTPLHVNFDSESEEDEYIPSDGGYLHTVANIQPGSPCVVSKDKSNMLDFSLQRNPSISSCVSTLDDDLKTKACFSYNTELEDSVKNWIETVLEERVFKGKYFADVLKSGIVLCNLLNKIQPGIVPKVQGSTVAFRQIDNIGNYIKGCMTMGIPRNHIFEVTDLLQQKNMKQVLQHLLFFARFIKTKRKDDFFPLIIEPVNLDLWTSCLTTIDQEIPIDSDEEVGQGEMSEEELDLISWMNSQLRPSFPDFVVRNVASLRSGLYILKLLEVLSNGTLGFYDQNSNTLRQHMHNVSLIFRFLSSQFLDRVDCHEPDVVKGNRKAIISLVRYIRGKYDRHFEFRRQVIIKSMEEMRIKKLSISDKENALLELFLNTILVDEGEPILTTMEKYYESLVLQKT